MKYLNFLIIASLIILNACSTNRYLTFNEVKVGQSRSDVLETVGGPDFRYFTEGKYIWRYKFYTETGLVEKEMHIEKGYVSYVGPLISRSEFKFLVLKNKKRNEVIESLGLPNKVYRNNGVETWVYSLELEDKTIIKEVLFEKGKVTSTQTENTEDFQSI